MLLYSRALFSPLEREVEADDVPVADYTDHSVSLNPGLDTEEDAPPVTVEKEKILPVDESMEVLEIEESLLFNLPEQVTREALEKMAEAVEKALEKSPTQTLSRGRAAFDWSDASQSAAEIALQIMGPSLTPESVAVVQ